MSIKDYASAEQTTLDYKEELEERRPKSWLKSVSAFANTSGGHLLFGVQDETHEVVGLEDPQYVISKVTELIQARSDLFLGLTSLHSVRMGLCAWI